MKNIALTLALLLLSSVTFADSQHLQNIDCKPQLIRAGFTKVIGNLNLETLMSAKLQVTDFEISNDSSNDYVLTVHAENDVSLDYEVGLKVLESKTCAIKTTFPY